MTIDIAALRALAEAVLTTMPRDMWAPGHDVMTDYLAALDPRTVLALLDEIERLRASLRGIVSEAPRLECETFSHHRRGDRHDGGEYCPPRLRWESALSDARGLLYEST